MGPQSRSWREILCRIRAQNYCRATLLVPNGRKNRSTSIGYRGFPEVSSIYRFPMSAQNRLPIFLLVGALFSLAYATEEQDETVPREFGGLAEVSASSKHGSRSEERRVGKECRSRGWRWL